MSETSSRESDISGAPGGGISSYLALRQEEKGGGGGGVLCFLQRGWLAGGYSTTVKW